MEPVAIIRIVFFAVAVITMFIATVFCYDNKKALYILGITSIVSAITFIILLCTTNWTIYAIAKIFSLVVILVALVITSEGWIEEYIIAGITCTMLIFVAFVVSLMVEGYMYSKNVHEVEQPKVVVTRQELLTANDGTQVSGNMSGGGFVIFHVTGSVSEESVYKYYYLLPDGGAKLGQVKADDTTIYYIENGESPYLEKIVSTKYCMDYNNNPPTECDHSWHATKTTYKLHVPKGSISNVYEFDAA